MRSPPGNGLVLLRIHSPRIIRHMHKTLDGTGPRNGATSIDHSLVHWTAAGSESISYIGWFDKKKTKYLNVIFSSLVGTWWHFSFSRSPFCTVLEINRSGVFEAEHKRGKHYQFPFLIQIAVTFVTSLLRVSSANI